MVRRTGPTNYLLQELLHQLAPYAKKNDFWRRISSDLQKPARQRRIVNLYKIEQCALDGETVVVPGKVLSDGELTKKIDIAAFTFSTQARRKITAAHSRALSISELLHHNPQAKKVRILG